MLSIQVIIQTESDDALIDSVWRLECALFPKPFFSREEYVAILGSPENVNILLKDGEKLCGCLFARPHNIVAREVREFHPEFEDIDNCYYVDTIEILPEYRRKGAFRLLLATLAHEVFTRFGIRKWSAHVRVLNGLDRVALSMFPVSESFLVDNFMEKGEAYRYMKGYATDKMLQSLDKALEKKQVA